MIRWWQTEHEDRGKTRITRKKPQWESPSRNSLKVLRTTELSCRSIPLR